MKADFQNEKKLLEGCVRQDKKSWDAFVERYHRLISHSIVLTLKRYAFPLENQIVEELFNTTFLSLLEDNCKKLRQFRWKCSLSSWLHIIAARVTIDFLRKQTEDISLNGETNDEVPLRDRTVNGNPLPDELVEHKEERAIFEQIKHGLTNREQFFIELYYNRELSASEISRIMNTTENNVYQMKSLVRKKMKRILGDLL